MNASCPISTPTLNSSSASGISARGRPSPVRPLAKPKPCSSPKRNATAQGCRRVKLEPPRQVRTISGPRNRIESAIAALSGAAGTETTLKVAAASAMLCETVNAVIVFTSIHRLRTMSSKPRTNSKWSTPSAMCSMPSTR